jgi:aryl-alcohol dehydrogenase-like predicted oxidoreductase
VLFELFNLRHRGIRIGLTVTGPRQADAIRRALEVRVSGQRLFETVQATWNILEPSAGAALADAKAEGCGVIVKEALANGRLTTRHGGDEIAAVAAYAAARGTTVERIAMATALAQPWADVVLSGAVTTTHLLDHVAALELSGDATRIASVAEAPDAYWQRRQNLEWT